MPQAITAPATGTASRLAGIDATGIGPKVARSTGATPSWAARVTPSASRMAAGPGRTELVGGAGRTRAAPAAIATAEPTEWTTRERENGVEGKRGVVRGGHRGG